MAVKRTLKRVVAGVPEALHPETTKAQVFQDSANTARSAFSLALFGITPDGTNKYLKIGVDGSITKVNTPEEFDVKGAVHTHPMSDVTVVSRSIWTATSGPAYDQDVVHYSIVDDASLVTYLTGYYTVPNGFVIRGYNESAPTTYYYAVASSTTTTLDAFMADQVDGKVPLVDDKIPKNFLPEYTAGHMDYKGGADLSAGTSEGLAVNIATVFPNLTTNPEEQLGDFKIVTNAGFLKADGTAGGTGFIHSNIEGPVWLNVGDRIIFAKYNTVGPEYTFALMITDYSKASTSLRGVVGLSDAASTNRGQLAAGSEGLNVVDEYTLKNAMRDVVYISALPVVYLPIPYTLDTFYVYYIDPSGVPTHTAGDGTGSFAPSSTVGTCMILSNGKSYTLKTYNAGSHTWTYQGTVAVPDMQQGAYARHYAINDDTYIVTSKTSNGAVYDKTSFVEGDLVIV